MLATLHHRPVRHQNGRALGDLLRLVAMIDERVRGADESIQARWGELGEQVSNLRRAIEMRRYRDEDLQAKVVELLDVCQRFYERVQQEGRPSTRRPKCLRRA